ncbi:uncharacterized protein UHOD_12175 [Ustilago sp. UG-2017b]|nr:uncharacterized protein UHOD_12175 [Ustilago sp. UG-2017b]
MLYFRFTSLLLLALTALTLVSCAVVNPQPIELLTDEHPRNIRDAEHINYAANFFERKLRLPQNYLSPATSYDQNSHGAAFEQALSHPDTRFMGVSPTTEGTFYAVPFRVLNGSPQRRVAFLYIERGGRVTPMIITAVKPENIPEMNHDFWSLLQTGAQKTLSELERHHGGLHL